MRTLSAALFILLFLVTISVALFASPKAVVFTVVAMMALFVAMNTLMDDPPNGNT